MWAEPVLGESTFFQQLHIECNHRDFWMECYRFAKR